MMMFITILGICKLFLKDIHYRPLLFVLNALFLGLVYPKPMHFFLLIIYAYLFTWLASNVFKFKKKIWGILILLLPMLLVKLEIKIDHYPFDLNNWFSFAGLSYASFRILSYYMDKVPGEKMPDLMSYFNYLAFTPTLLIGPIDRFSRFEASEKKGFSNMNGGTFIEGWEAFIKGLAFKFVLAELVNRYWLGLYPASSMEAGSILNNMYAYYVYLFFDFAGYSWMALGIGKMMGIAVPVNFTNPFVAENPQDFWRRFHISLGDWLRDYFFTPLYLYFTRKKSLKKYPLSRQNFALFMTFLLMGCWNGFHTNFILSGMIFGLFSVVHNTYVAQCKKAGKDVLYGKMNATAVKYINIFIMFNMAAFALYIFSGRCPFI
jgi:membrane protein involved in D-alanine export